MTALLCVGDKEPRGLLLCKSFGAEPQVLRCFRQSLKTWFALGRARRLELLWAEPEDLLETEVAVAEGGRDPRVLGDPMDLIRCQNYLAEPTVANSTLTRQVALQEKC